MVAIRETHELHAREDKDTDAIARDLEEVLHEFRQSVHAAADRPGCFWKRQYEAIEMRLQDKTVPSKRRTTLAWVPACLLVLVCCLLLFVQNSKAPTPDLAAGSDQNLLTEIERALNQYGPSALEPAELLKHEINQVKK